MLDDNFIPIPDCVSRFEYFTKVHKPATFNPANAPDASDEYQAIYDSLVRQRVNVQFIKPSDHGLTYEIAPIYSDTQKPEYRASLKLEFQGKFVAAAIRYPSDRKFSRHKRGKITGFSHGSRTRMFDLFHKLEIKVKPIFITLTFGEDYPDAKTAKSHLRAFFERLRRKFKQGRVSAIWRMEFQERGAPHFHIIFFDLPFIRKEKIQEWWGEIIALDKPFTRIEQIKSHRGVMSYVSKYVAKLQDGGVSGFNSLTYLHAYQARYGENIGRVWGKFECANLPFAASLTLERDFVPAEFYKFRELAATIYPQIADYLSPGFRLYVKSAVQWEQIARYMFDDAPAPPLTL